MDHQAIGKVGAFDYADPIWAEWLSAVDGSQAIGALKGLPYDRVRDYYLSHAEIWARSYSQWVALKSRRPDLTQAIDRIRGHSFAPYRESQWDWGDFQPIAEAIDHMFGKLGWL